MLKLALLILSIEAMAGEDAYCDKNDLRYLFAKVHNMDKPMKELNTQVEELYSGMKDIREQLRNITESTETNGGWSVWADWTDCTATCNTGVQTRHRQCNNPQPSSGGQYCQGSQMDVVHCNKQQCSRAKSSFRANGATRLSTGILSFSTVQLNEGSYFDGGSGTFTCQLSGLYFFTATIVEGGEKDNTVSCYINKNDVTAVSVFYLNGFDSHGRRPQNGYGVATGSATLHLTNRDRVNVLCNTDTLSVSFSSFTGFLIAEDP